MVSSDSFKLVCCNIPTSFVKPPTFQPTNEKAEQWHQFIAIETRPKWLWVSSPNLFYNWGRLKIVNNLKISTNIQYFQDFKLISFMSVL